MYTSRDESQRKQINAFMTAFQEHPQSWTRVDTILEKTQCEQSKFFALATLEHCVKYRCVFFTGKAISTHYGKQRF
jgi:hypothetical protein